MPSGLQLTIPDLDGAPLVLDVDNFYTSQDPVPAFMGGGSVAGPVPSVPTIEISVKCLMGSDVFHRLMEWRQSVYNSTTGLAGNMADYNKEGVLHFVGDADHAVAERWVHGLWPTGYELSGEPGGLACVTLMAALMVDGTPKSGIEFKEEVSEEEKAAIIEALTPTVMRTLNRFGAVLAGGDE